MPGVTVPGVVLLPDDPVPDVPLPDDDPIPEVPVPDVPVPEVPVPAVPVPLPEAPLEPEVPLDPCVAQSLLSDPEELVPGLVADAPEPDMPEEEEVPLDCREAQSTLPCAPGVLVAPVPLPEAPLEPESPEEVLLPVALLDPLLPEPEGHVPEGHDCAVDIPACASIRMKSAEESFFMLPPSREMNERFAGARSMPILSGIFDRERGLLCRDCAFFCNDDGDIYKSV